MKVDFTYVMAVGEIDQLLPAIEAAKKAGIMVMGVPPQKLAPFWVVGGLPVSLLRRET